MQADIFQAVKQATNGQAVEFLTSVGGIPAELLDGRHHPCPKCGGHDRFSLVDRSAGAVLCRKCFDAKNGDFIAAIAWHRGIEQIEAAKLCAHRLGILDQVDPRPTDVIEEVERAKSIPRGWLSKYGAAIADGKYGKVARLPVYDANGEQCGHCDLTTKGTYYKKGKGTAGLFLPHADDGNPIRPAGEVVIVEGGKDSPTLYSMGYFAIGLPRNEMAAKFAKLFLGCNVTILPDLDTAGIGGATTTASRLYRIASTVRIARPPGEVKATNGDDVRDHLKRIGGEELIRRAIAEAKPWEPGQSTSDGTTDDSPLSISNAVVELKPDDEGELKETTVPLSITSILARIHKRIDGWPRRVGNMLFIHDSAGVSWLESTASLFGCLSSAAGVIEWHRKIGCCSKDEVFQELKRTATSYTAIETLPHYPRLANHYYSCEFPANGSGEHLSRFLDCFCPATPIDRDLIQALAMTLFWGGSPGARPAFVINGPAGRGIGKSKLVEMLGELSAPPIAFDAGDKINDIKQRLLSPDAMQGRIGLLDNVKSHRLSWAELEGLITAPQISGKRMYHGDASRPNTLTWCVTLNGVALSTDMAQRSVMIELDKPKRSASWEEDTRAFIQEHRQQIIGDILAELQREPYALDQFSRWASWEREILQRLPEPSEAQKVIAERQKGADVEEEEAKIIEEYFASQLRWAGYFWMEQTVFIPGNIAWKWYMAATGDRVTHGKATKIVGQLIDEGRMDRLTRHRQASSRGFAWNVTKSADIQTDLEEKMASAEKAKCEELRL